MENSTINADAYGMAVRDTDKKLHVWMVPAAVAEQIEKSVNRTSSLPIQEIP
jgi:hypothetical protein